MRPEALHLAKRLLDSLGMGWALNGAFTWGVASTACLDDELARFDASGNVGRALMPAVLATLRERAGGLPRAPRRSGSFVSGLKFPMRRGFSSVFTIHPFHKRGPVSTSARPLERSTISPRLHRHGL